ncbi:MAG: tol-pal system-associated acyl-CoA thioesterase [Lysobacterales bacterium CG17_big_fil_post_rev_8_21_14_2_50_64_11]|nr:MAG: tol-pal system-associated acyl-CoA thioesterase [Xanthomonadales bacterium CG17_big_fil_post_rev_8_21_14_2_50_64_11]PIX60541.1 MAG: tol-pal system-associated acyl-CoA thioesterase [Xanthomonadales bacterium CG_4_10_14_3_um_filter_64_11]
MSRVADRGAGIGPSFMHSCRVYWEDTDAGGVVYHASYIRFLERARSEWLRSLGVGQQDLREREDMLFAVCGMQIDFLAPARLDDVLSVSVQVTRARLASLMFAQQIRCGERVLVEASVRAACLTASLFRPRPLPAWLWQRIHSLDKVK